MPHDRIDRSRWAGKHVSTMQDSGHTPDWPDAGIERVMRNGKRIFTTAFKAWLVEQAGKPGAPVAGLAMQHGINANQLRRWMRLQHLHAAAPMQALLPVTVARAAAIGAPPPHSPALIEIELAGALVRVGAGVDEQHLRCVLQALRALA